MSRTPYGREVRQSVTQNRGINMKRAGLTVAVVVGLLGLASASAEALQVSIDPKTMTLTGLPALSADGATLALPVIRFETDPMGSQTTCYQFVVRIAPVGRSTGEDISLPQICGSSEADSILAPDPDVEGSGQQAATNAALLAEPLRVLNERLKAGNYAPLMLSLSNTGGANWNDVPMPGLNVKVSFETRKTAIAVLMGKKTVGTAKAATKLFPQWESVGARSIGATLVRGKINYAYVAIGWSDEGTDNSAVREDVWIPVELKVSPPAAEAVSRPAPALAALAAPALEVEASQVKLDLPSVPALVIPPATGDRRSPRELRLAGSRDLGATVVVEGYVVWSYDCAVAIAGSTMSLEEARKEIVASPERCSKPHYYLGDTPAASPDDAIWVVDVPKPAPSSRPGTRVRVTGTWLTQSPGGFASARGLLVQRSFEEVK
jgi:hypothetical protein